MKEVDLILKDIKSGNLAPIYFLMGEEPYFIDLISNYIAANVLSEQEKGFNQMILYGKEATLSDIINNAKRYPMMAPYQVIIVKEAQGLSGNWDDLYAYVEQPQTQTILVFCYKYKTLDKRKKITKLLAQGKSVLLESKPLRDYQMGAWITSYVAAKEYRIDAKAVQMLVDFIGTDLSRMANELDKLFVAAVETRQITPEIIEENIGISKDFNVFELQRALIEDNRRGVARILQYFSAHSKEYSIIQIVATLYSFFQKVLTYHGLKDFSETHAAHQLKVPPYFVKDYRAMAQRLPMRSVSQILMELHHLDAKSKGVGVSQSDSVELYKELFLLLSRNMKKG